MLPYLLCINYHHQKVFCLSGISVYDLKYIFSVSKLCNLYRLYHMKRKRIFNYSLIVMLITTCSSIWFVRSSMGATITSSIAVSESVAASCTITASPLAFGKLYHKQKLSIAPLFCYRQLPYLRQDTHSAYGNSWYIY